MYKHDLIERKNEFILQKLLNKIKKHKTEKKQKQIGFDPGTSLEEFMSLDLKFFFLRLNRWNKCKSHLSAKHLVHVELEGK